MINVQNMYLKKNLNRGNSHKQISNSEELLLPLLQTISPKLPTSKCTWWNNLSQPKGKKRGKIKKLSILLSWILHMQFQLSPGYQFDNSLVFRKCQQGLPLPTIQRRKPGLPLIKESTQEIHFSFSLNWAASKLNTFYHEYMLTPSKDVRSDVSIGLRQLM